ncbi:hypothetical protein M378DRAFT_169154 [Amanita muscaria Koide BX008]|uniref:Uncharacterized protein n=1 Tax=Amanita muscaria (strain Koide BX008) TaxID=946122 RepID=A0A0C2S9R3_AMAMK|nr:hypothetical protein M378DRAFT_169154 [Amanita muscaria Koide BX008]
MRKEQSQTRSTFAVACITIKDPEPLHYTGSHKPTKPHISASLPLTCSNQSLVSTNSFVFSSFAIEGRTPTPVST